MRTIRILLALLLVHTAAYAYETPVHRKITESAFMLAAQQNGFMARIGLTETSVFLYPPRTAAVVAADGSTLEDDGSRPLNHFFEPTGGYPLMAPPFACFTPGQRADSWAIDGWFNSYSIADTHQHLRTAIVGPTPSIRELGFRDTFRNLGQVVHLIQDMAQPEHTRNDQHLLGNGMPNGKCTPGSLYEKWTLNNLTGTTALPYAANFFVGFEVIKMPSYEAYFRDANGRGMAEFSNGNFVTQDTNYDTYGNTWGPLTGRCVTFTEPRREDATPRIENVTETVVNDPCCPGPTVVTIPEYVYSYDTVDRYKNVSTLDNYHNHLSSIDHEISLISMSDPLNGGEGLWSLSNHSYRSRAAILIPRAVEYSAGIIDRFFRGKINVGWGQNQDGTWNMTITNQSSEAIGPGVRVTAVYKATPQYFNRVTTEDTEVIIDDWLHAIVPGFETLEPGEQVTLANLPVFGLHTGDSLMQFERRVVLTGPLGSEFAVIPVVQKASGMRVQVDAMPDLVTSRLLCGAGGTIPLQNGVQKEFAVAQNQECRVLLQHQQIAKIDYEGTPTFIRVRVWRGSALVEDISATIDASDAAVGGCHRFTTDGRCDRFISRTGNCIQQSGYQNNTKCFTTMEHWSWGSDPY